MVRQCALGLSILTNTYQVYSSIVGQFLKCSSMGARFVNIDEHVSGIDELLTNQY